MVFFPAPKAEIKATDEYIRELEERIRVAFNKLDVLTYVKLVEPEIIGKIGKIDVGTLNVNNLNVSGKISRLDVDDIRVSILKIVDTVNVSGVMVVGDDANDKLIVNADTIANTPIRFNHVKTFAKIIYSDFYVSEDPPEPSQELEGCILFRRTEDSRVSVWICGSIEGVYQWIHVAGDTGW